MKRSVKNSILIAAYAIFILSNPSIGQDAHLLWAKSIGANYTDNVIAIAIDEAGNVFSTGGFSGTVDFDPGSGVYNLTAPGQMGHSTFVCKHTSSGAIVWAKLLGGAQGSIADVSSIAIDLAGNVYTAGYYQGTVDFDPGTAAYNITNGAGGIFVSKLNSLGVFVWAKSMGGAQGSSAKACSIAIDVSGNVYTTGYFIATVDFDPGTAVFNIISPTSNMDIFISKLDFSGAFVWAKSMGSTNPDAGRSIAVDAMGNVYTTGYFTGTVDFDPGAGVYNLTSPGNTDIYISKLNASGAFVWAKRMGGGAGSDLHDYGYDIALDNSGNIYTTGSFAGTVDFNSGGPPNNLTTTSYSAVFICKHDASGALSWVKKIEGAVVNDYSSGVSVAVDAAGNIYSTGSFSGTIDADPGTSLLNLTSQGDHDVFISKLDASGVFVWGKSIGSASYDAGNSVAVDTAGNVYVAGAFIGSCDFDPGVGVSNLMSAGDVDGFVVKLCEMATPTITASGSTSICQGENVTLTSSLSNSYLWSNGATTQSIVVDTTGSYSVTVTNTNGCSASSTIENVNVTSAPQFTYTTNALVVSFSKTGTGCNSFLWDFGNGNTSSINPNPIVTYANQGTYSACLQCNGNVCVTCITITLPEGTVSVGENSNQSDISIYPNPSNDFITIENKNEKLNSTYIVFSSLGQQVLTGKLIAETTTVDVSDLQAGFYLLQVGETKKQSFKLVKK
jgi:hypothetical protein